MTRRRRAASGCVARSGTPGRVPHATAWSTRPCHPVPIRYLNCDKLHRRGAILILVLWAIIILALLTGGVSMAVREDQSIGDITQDRMCAHWAARAGVEQGIAMLMDDLTRGLDDHQDLWSNNEADFKNASVGTGTFSLIEERFEETPNDYYGCGDESAKVNVNVATREQLMKLRDMTAPIAGAILDWRDQDDTAQADGIERGHYSALAHPFIIRNGPLRTVRELLLVRDVTPDLFYGEDTNVNGRLDANENDGEASEPPDNADGRLDRGWYAYLTIYSFEPNLNGLGQERVNLKNADAATLAMKLDLEEWAAQSIVKRREQSEFRHLVDLLDVPLDPQVSRGSPGDDTRSRGDEERDKPVTKAILQEIIDDLTLSEEKLISGRVNLNTAPLEVLKTLMDDEIAQAVFRSRQSGGTFDSIADLLDVNGMTKEKFAALENSVTVRSCVFRILSRGESSSGLANETIECVVDRSQDIPRVLYWLESSP